MAFSFVYTDFDGTLVFSNSFLHLIAIRRIAFQAKRDLLSGVLLVLTYMALPLLVILHLTNERLRDYATYALYFGLTNDEVYQYARVYWRGNRQRLNLKVLDLLVAHWTKGSKVVVVSGSLVEIIQAALSEFDLGHFIDTVIGAELLPTAHGARHPAGILKTGPMIGANKVIAIRAYERDLQGSIIRRTAVTDSISDLALLLVADEGYLVRPSRRLRGWGSQLNCVEI